MNTAAEVAFILVMAAVVFSLVRPNSPAGKAVPLFADAVAGVVGTATGYVQRGG